VDDFVVDFQFDAAEARISYVSSLRTILHDALPRSLSKSAVVRSGTVATVGCHPQLTTRVTLDTGADSGSYIGGDAVRALGSNVATEPCRHRVRLGDGKTMVTVHQIVYVDIQLEDNYGDHTDPITTAFMSFLLWATKSSLVFLIFLGTTLITFLSSFMRLVKID